MEALGHGFPYDEVPSEFKEDHALLQASVKMKCSVYMQLPAALKQNIALASEAILACTTLGDINVLHEASKYAPGAFLDRETMMTAAQKLNSTLVKVGYCQDLPQNDKEFVMLFLKINGAIYELLNEGHQSDPEVFACAINSVIVSSPARILKSIPKRVLLEPV